MLDMGFIHDVRRILGWLPAQKQTLFSPPLCPRGAGAGGLPAAQPARVAVNPISSPVEVIDQKLYYVDRGNKTRLLAALIGAGREKRPGVYPHQARGQQGGRDLVKAGISAAAIHGNKSQTARQQAWPTSRAARCRFWWPPTSPPGAWTLRSSPRVQLQPARRTGDLRPPHRPHRPAGRGGTAISFCDINEKDELKAIEKLIGRAIPVVEVHPGPWRCWSPAPRQEGPVVNPEDAEARAAAKERRRQRDAANKAAAEARKAKANQKVLEQPPQPEPAGETSAKKRRKRGQRNSATLEEALTATAPPGRFRRSLPTSTSPTPWPATRSWTPPPACWPLAAGPRPHRKRTNQLNSPLKSGRRPPGPGTPCEAGAQAARKRKGGGRHGGRGRPPEVTLRTNGQKDSTEQPSLMKPYYLSHD